MDGIFDLILSLISIPKIMALPIYIKIVGLAIAGLMFFSSILSLFSLALFSAIARFVAGLAVLILLSRGGEALVAMFG